jgi:hypothetical protein
MYRAIYLPEGVDWAKATSENTIIRAAIQRAVEKEIKETNMRFQDFVLVVSPLESRAMADSEEIGMFAESMPDELGKTFAMRGHPDKLYGIPVEVRYHTKYPVVLENGEELC